MEDTQVGGQTTDGVAAATGNEGQENKVVENTPDNVVENNNADGNTSV